MGVLARREAGMLVRTGNYEGIVVGTRNERFELEVAGGG